jgi:hypothetical protein
MKISILSIIIITSLFSSCSNNNFERPLNPNGDSELALLMRQMYEDGMLAKQAILEDKEISTILRHEKILTAEATEPEKAGSDLYKSFANNYLELMAQVNDPKNPNRKESYSKLVNSCLQCHKAICPGPVVKIKKMVLE